MARPVIVSDTKILEAARTLFVRNGINATTKDIARQAGVSEGSLFRRFPTKEALFIAAVMNPPPPAWVRELDALVGTGDPRENLIHIVSGMLKFAQELLPLIMVAWGRKSESPVPPLETDEPPDIRDRRLLTNYLRKEIDGGRLRCCNAESVARMLFGGCLNLVMERLTLQQPLLPDEAELFVEGLVGALWNGIDSHDNGTV